VDFAFAWLAEYSYAFVLVAAAIDATALPFPGRLVLIAAGVLAAAGRAELLGTIAAGLAGAVAGDHLWYFGGRLAGGRLKALSRWLARRWDRMATDPADYLRRHGGVTIVIGRFVATVRVLVVPLASAHGIGYGRFVAWDLPAATVWAVAFVGGGYLLGRPALAVMEGFGGPAIVVATVGLVALAGVVLLLRRRAPSRGRRRRRPQAGRRG
jgi:membrane protein DedA with SNARE-associated domain